MFKRKRNLFVLFSAVFLVSAFMLISNAITGQASSISGDGAQGLGLGLININSVEISIVEYSPLQDDPTRIKSIRLEAVDDQLTEDVSILVSVDGGNNWVDCKNSEASIWICTFSDSIAPFIIEMQTIELVVNG